MSLLLRAKEALLKMIKEFLQRPKYLYIITFILLFIIFPFSMSIYNRQESKKEGPDPFKNPECLLVQNICDLDRNKIRQFQNLTSAYDQDYVQSRIPAFCTPFAKALIKAFYEIPDFDIIAVLGVVEEDAYYYLSSNNFDKVKQVYKCKCLRPYFKAMLKPIVKYWELEALRDIENVFSKLPIDNCNLRKLLNDANWLAQGHNDRFQKFLWKLKKPNFITTLLKISSLHPGKSSFIGTKPTVVWASMAKEFSNWKKELYFQLREPPDSDLPESHVENLTEIKTFEEAFLNYHHCTSEVLVFLKFLYGNSNFYTCHEDLSRSLSPFFPENYDFLTWYAVFDPKAFKAFIFHYFKVLNPSPNDYNIFLTDFERRYISRIVQFAVDQPNYINYINCILNPEYDLLYLKFDSKIPFYVSEEIFINDDPVKRLFELTRLEETPNQFIEFDTFWENSPSKDSLTKIYLNSLYCIYLDSLTISPLQKSALKDKLTSDRYLTLCKPDSFSSKYLFRGLSGATAYTNFIRDLSQINYHDLNCLIRFLIERDSFGKESHLQGAKFLCNIYEREMRNLKERNMENNHANALIVKSFLEFVLPNHSFGFTNANSNILKPLLGSSAPWAVETIDKFCLFSKNLSQIFCTQSCLAAEFHQVFIESDSIKDFKHFILLNSFTWRQENYEAIGGILEFISESGKKYHFGEKQIAFNRDCYILFQLSFTILDFNSNISIFSKNKFFFKRLLELANDKEASLDLIIDSLKFEYEECVKATNLNSHCFKTLSKLVEIAKLNLKSILYITLLYVETMIRAQQIIATQQTMEKELDTEKEIPLNPTLYQAAKVFIINDSNRIYRFANIKAFHDQLMLNSKDFASIYDLSSFEIPVAPIIDLIYGSDKRENFSDLLEMIKKLIKEVECFDFSVKENTPILLKFNEIRDFYYQNVIENIASFYQQKMKEKYKYETNYVHLSQIIKREILNCLEVPTDETSQKISNRFENYRHLEHICFGSEYVPGHYENVLIKRFNNLIDLIIANFLCPIELAHLVNSLKNRFLVVKKLKKIDPLLAESASLPDQRG
jgi:hypothetical protein